MINYKYFDHICLVHEDNLIGIKFPDKDWSKGDDVLNKYFEKIDGEWHLKPYHALGEYFNLHNRLD